MLAEKAGEWVPAEALVMRLLTVMPPDYLIALGDKRRALMNRLNGTSPRSHSLDRRVLAGAGRLVSVVMNGLLSGNTRCDKGRLECRGRFTTRAYRLDPVCER